MRMHVFKNGLAKNSRIFKNVLSTNWMNMSVLVLTKPVSAGRVHRTALLPQMVAAGLLMAASAAAQAAVESSDVAAAATSESVAQMVALANQDNDGLGVDADAVESGAFEGGALENAAWERIAMEDDGYIDGIDTEAGAESTQDPEAVGFDEGDSDFEDGSASELGFNDWNNGVSETSNSQNMTPATQTTVRGDVFASENSGNRQETLVMQDEVYTQPHQPIVTDAVRQVPLNAISPETLRTFVSLIDLVRRDYVEPVSDEALFVDAMSGMLSKLDSHAEFLDAEAYEQLRAFTEGDVGNIGIQANFEPAVNHWVVSQVSADSSAALADIEVGDYLHQIGDSKLDEDKTANDVKQLLTGIAGSQVDVVVSSAGRRKHTVTLQRTLSVKQGIDVAMQEGIAVVTLPVFQNTTRQQLLQGLSGLNAPVTGLVLDVRNNPGGVLESAVSIASLLMSNTTVVQIENRDGIENVLNTEGAAQLERLPVVVLQNRYSASAAEVLASSLQTQKRATVMGETSYGKGSVQSVIPLNDEQAVKLTVAHYLTADGKQIEGVGVVPDRVLQGEQASWRQQAVNFMKTQALAEGVRFVQN